MIKYYGLNAIPVILNKFDVKKIIFSGTYDETLENIVLNYCAENNVPHVQINQNGFEQDNNDYPFNDLSNLKDYDAIFINDDPNWYTVYNELKLIKHNNNKFPLVFICNNIFPHKRRDSYSNPNIIPKEFRKNYDKELKLGNVIINDDFYHAIEDNSTKNGVLTAIEDFLSDDNSGVAMMDFKLVNDITILYSKMNIEKNMMMSLFLELKNYILDYEDLFEYIVKNKMLTNDCDIFDDYKIQLSEKNKIISEFEDKLQICLDELNLKDSKINNFDSKLNLKDAQIKNIESKLVNRENLIRNLKIEINSLNEIIAQNSADFRNLEYEFNDQVSSLQDEIKKNELDLENKKNKFNDDINYLNLIISKKEENEICFNTKLKEITEEIKINQNKLDLIKRQNTSYLSSLENKKYCINCYKEKISNNDLEIGYLKKNSFIKKILSPLAYIYLIFKSNPNELSLNFKLYKSLKNSECFDIGYYLKNNDDIIMSNWCKYFSPELHYVCNGFNEGRKFNKKYFNRNSKKELLKYILECNNRFKF